MHLLRKSWLVLLATCTACLVACSTVDNEPIVQDSNLPILNLIGARALAIDESMRAGDLPESIGVGNDGILYFSIPEAGWWGMWRVFGFESIEQLEQDGSHIFGLSSSTPNHRLPSGFAPLGTRITLDIAGLLEHLAYYQGDQEHISTFLRTGGVIRIKFEFVPCSRWPPAPRMIGSGKKFVIDVDVAPM